MKRLLLLIAALCSISVAAQLPYAARDSVNRLPQQDYKQTPGHPGIQKNDMRPGVPGNAKTVVNLI